MSGRSFSRGGHRASSPSPPWSALPASAESREKAAFLNKPKNIRIFRKPHPHRTATSKPGCVAVFFFRHCHAYDNQCLK